MKGNSLLKLKLYIKYGEHLHLPMPLVITYSPSLSTVLAITLLVLVRFNICILRIISYMVLF